MASKKYTEAEQEAYKRGLAAAGKKTKRSRSGSTATRSTARRKGRAAYGTRKRTAKRASGCIYYNPGWKRSDGSTSDVPKIFAWRYFGKGANRVKQTMTAYLDKNGGKPRRGDADCTVWVCNLITVGQSSSTETGVLGKYGKLNITKLGLVCNPQLEGGGYFGRGGSAYRGKVNK